MNFYCVVLLLLIPLLSGHICMIWPPQRGGWNAGGAAAGDSHCFQPNAPCGSPPPGTPVAITSDSTLYVEFQQNLNHYSPGYPGFISISYAQGSNPPNDDAFILLAEIPDPWVHLQAAQTNISVPVLIPDISCPVCTLQIKYHPNKPTEPIFHNCADVNFQRSNYVFSKRIFAFVSDDPYETYVSDLVEIFPDGRLLETGLMIHLFKRQIVLNQFLSNGVIAFLPQNNSLFFIGDSLQVFLNGITAPNTLYSYNIDESIFSEIGQLQRSGVQWVALLPYNTGLIGVQQTLISGHYAFVVSVISLNGMVKDIATTLPDDTFVNFFWADIDPVRGAVYILSGDENSLFELDATLYTVNLTDATVHAIKVDDTAYTLSNLHVDPQSGLIYSVSPGLYNKLAWTIVVVNPQTGAVTSKSAISGSAIWGRNYGGGVYNGISSNQIFHTFKWQNSGATALTVLDISTGGLLYLTDINLGINNRRSINSIIAI